MACVPDCGFWFLGYGFLALGYGLLALPEFSLGFDPRHGAFVFSSQALSSGL